MAARNAFFTDVDFHLEAPEGALDALIAEEPWMLRRIDEALDDGSLDMDTTPSGGERYTWKCRTHGMAEVEVAEVLADWAREHGYPCGLVLTPASWWY